MSGRFMIPSIATTPRRVALPMLVLVGVVLLMLRPSSDLVYTPRSATAAGDYPHQHHEDVANSPGGSYQGQRAQQPAHNNADDQFQQQEYLNDPSLLRQSSSSSSSSRHDGHKVGSQWDWDWVKKVTTDKMKSRLGWSESGQYDDGRMSSSVKQSSPHDAVAFHGASNAQEDEAMAYHRHLEAEHAPHQYLHHSPTLTFDRIYVLSLPHRTDRRSRMSKIARALGFKFTFVDATSKDEPIIGWIAERVKEIREKKLKILSKLLDKPESEIGGMGTNSLWLKGEDPKFGYALPDLTTLDDRWKLDSYKSGSSADDETAEQDEALQNSETSPVEQQTVDWVSYLESTDKLDLLKPSDPKLNVTEILHDPVEPLSARQVNDGVVATWYSQTRVWKKMVENKDKSALILEDDVDIEWDIERLWPNVERSLPEDWEVVFLGHCWGRELGKPQYVHPQLHKASEPRCLHGYALSQKGAQHLLKLFSDPWRAYQTPVDTFMPYLTRITPWEEKGKPVQYDHSQYIQAFSMEPAVIIQSKELSSDIQNGVGSSWRGLLSDSTWDRIQRDEGHEVKQLTWDDIRRDPAVKARPWGDWGKAKPATAPKHPDDVEGTPKSPFEHFPEGNQDNQQDQPLTQGSLTSGEERSKAREQAMARVVDPEQLEKERVLQNMAKKPGPMMEGGKNKGSDGNNNVAAAQIQAAIEAAKKGGAHGGRRKGDGNRIGTGPKRLGHDK